jgi:hypothetical protein
MECSQRTWIKGQSSATRWQTQLDVVEYRIWQETIWNQYHGEQAPGLGPRRRRDVRRSIRIHKHYILSRSLKQGS